VYIHSYQLLSLVILGKFQKKIDFIFLLYIFKPNNMLTPIILEYNKKYLNLESLYKLNLYFIDNEYYKV
jgi:hypothetical protein